VLLPFSSPSPPSLSLLPVPFLPSPSLLPPTAAATPFPFGLLVSVSCLAFGGATQRNEKRPGPLCFIQNAPENVPHISYTFPSFLTVSLHLASPGPRCVTRYVTNGRFPPLHPPPGPHHYQARVFWCEISPKFEKSKHNFTTEYSVELLPLFL